LQFSYKLITDCQAFPFYKQEIVSLKENFKLLKFEASLIKGQRNSMYRYGIRTRFETLDMQFAAASYASKILKKKAMKKFNLIIIVICFFGHFFPSSEILSQPGWIIRSTALNINSVYFINPSKGWIVGDSGLAFATYDGGINWSGLDSKTTNKLISVFFIDEYTGWAAGHAGTIIRTTDGGNNWSISSSGVAWNITSIQFTDYDTGYATGAANLKSTDGGLSWTEISLSLSSNFAFYVSGLNGFFVNSSNIFKTTTGGFSWFTTIFSGSYNSVFFTNTTTGWVSGSGIRYTTNAGVNWTVQTTGAGFSTLYGINFSDASTGWSVGSIGVSGGNSEIRRTINSGTNWTGQSSGTTNILRSVSAVTSSNGVTVGDAGTILLTSNGGSNWSNMLHAYTFPSSPVYTLSSVFFADDNTGWSGGQLGIINKTTNAGSTWNSFSSASFNHINSIHFLDKDTGWIAGAGGMIQISGNGGVNWSSQSLSTSESVNDIHIGKYTLTGYFGLHRIGWCVTNNGGIYKTTNGGGNWIGQTSPTTAHIYSVVGFSENDAIACSDSGKILKTTDGGTVWSVYVSGAVGGALRALSFADSNNGICVGDSATVLYTTNQGSSWTLDITGPRSITSKNLYGVSSRMKVMAEYTAVGEEGIILKTEDEGSSWTKLSSGIKTRLFGITSPSDDAAFVSGSRGTILKTVDGGALPVELLSFTFRQDENDVTLSWITSSEINNKGFFVERNKNNEKWDRVGFVQGIGNTNNQSIYDYSDFNLENGLYKYRLKQIDYNGNFEYYNLNSEIIIGQPEEYILYQNYPNPFNPVTTIRYDIPKRSRVVIKVYDILGKEVMTLLNEFKEAGSYKLTVNGDKLSSGIYFYSLQSADIKIVKKFCLIK